VNSAKIQIFGDRKCVCPENTAGSPVIIFLHCQNSGSARLSEGWFGYPGKIRLKKISELLAAATLAIWRDALSQCSKSSNI
jgi:hypothetical protein